MKCYRKQSWYSQYVVDFMRRQVSLTFEFMGELAVDSQDVPSYRPGVISGVIR